MANYYFEVIITSQVGDEVTAGITHRQKLNNYINYGWADTTVPANRQKLSKPIEVESQSTSTAMKNHNFVITTVLCCERNEERGEKV